MTSSYANSGDDRLRLQEHLVALMATEATEIRRLLQGATSPNDEEIAAALARYEAASKVEDSLLKNSNVPLSLEAAWLGYPLIHNAALCADIGYFYPGFDVALGAAALRSALERHDVRDAAYRSTQHERLDRFRATNPANVATYEQLLDRAWAR